MVQKPGFRFQPTDEELINYYLKNKVMGNSCLVDDTISEINILNHHPSSLPSLSRIKSNDYIYYFFAPKQYRTKTTSLRKRSTNTWKWLMTGTVVDIEDKSGNKIGERQGLRFRDLKAPKLKGEKSRWTMHEYQITSLPHHNLDSYVICKIYDKFGKKADITNGNSSSELSPSLVSDSKTIRVTSIPPVFQVEQQRGQDSYYGLSENDLRTPLNEQEDLSLWDGFDQNTFLSNNNDNVQLQDDDEFICGLPPAYRGIAQHLLSDQDSIMQEEYNDYMLKNTVISEFEQTGQENVYGLCADELRVTINLQEDLVPQDTAFVPNTLFNNYNYPHVQLQTPYSDDYWSGLFQDMLSDQEFAMQENRNDYKPKKSLSGIIVDYSSDSDSDSDAESIPATSYKGTSSPGDSVGNSNIHSQTSLYEIVSLSKDIQTSDEPSISRKTRESQLARHTILLKKEVKQGIRKTEMKDSPYIYLINMIIGFILLLALIGDIISV